MQSDLHLIAYFERVAFEVNNIAGEGGHISGEAFQSVLFMMSQMVTAITDGGYKFVM